ncbi:ammonium transporter [Shewanella sp. VB17]|uniref:ammonium transporter n=1 Tax=Shewanella sp. VB17 TaxID=2739432 RepID=UPI001563D631|nr:ammonium transporter [Shewanella sp. VB17]NRD75404.1 ammonium transporter [Shewanella sp. VB17]
MSLWPCAYFNLYCVETIYGVPLELELAKVIETQNIMWILISTGSVLFMQAGFCFLEAGSVRSKNSINVAVKNFCDFCLASALFWAVGFAVMYSSADQLVNYDYLFLQGDNSPMLLTFFVFQLVFCGTAATIMSGAVAERTTFVGYLCIAFFVSSIIYPVFGRWAWNGGFEGINLGWLKQQGFVDFAGSSVVHSVGGWASLAAVMVIGPRIGRFVKELPPIQGHNIPMATVGTIILWFGWFGFNGGSALKFDDTIPLILINTTLSASCGAIATLILTGSRKQKPSVLHVLNGAIAGLVSITASCNSVSSYQAVIIGLFAGAIYLAGCRALEHFKIDDVVKAVPVHGLCGAWGTLCVALFGSADILNTGLSFSEQITVQIFGIVICFTWAFFPTYLFLKLINRVIPLRVTSEDEIRGLNISEHGANNEVVELLEAMEKHKQKGDFDERVIEEPHTEVGQIAKEYNRVLSIVTEEMENSNKANIDLENSFKLLQDAQLQLVESEKMASLGGMVAGIAHEINTPLGVSLTASSFLKDEVSLLEAQYLEGELSEDSIEKFIAGAKEGSEIILLNLHRATELVKSFKKVSVDQSSDKYREFDLKNYINEILMSLQPKFRQTKHQINVSCPEGIVIFSHPGALSQIISSFLMNSLHHGFEEINEGMIEIKASLEAGTVCITYQDNGSGISATNLEHVFEPFYTTKHGKGGSGLGLHIVYNLATETLGGDIKCVSEPNVCTLFTLTFPVTPRAD